MRAGTWICNPVFCHFRPPDAEPGRDAFNLWTHELKTESRYISTDRLSFLYWEDNLSGYLSG